VLPFALLALIRSMPVSLVTAASSTATVMVLVANEG
jgi:hypothetical protein